nr:MAG TPA: hypothetical protein [Caudoviricetes sp.]
MHHFINLLTLNDNLLYITVLINKFIYIYFYL